MNSGQGGGRHEIDIVLPTWNDVNVKVSGNSGTCRLAEIDADIESVRRKGGFECGFDGAHGLKEFAHFVVTQVVEIGNGAVREDHGVAGIIRKPIEKRKTGFPPKDDEVFFVFVALGDVGKKRGTIGVCLVDIGVAPRCPEMIHGRIHTGSPNGRQSRIFLPSPSHCIQRAIRGEKWILSLAKSAKARRMEFDLKTNEGFLAPWRTWRENRFCSGSH